MSLFENIIQESLTHFITPIVMYPIAPYQNSNTSDMEISFQLDPAVQVELLESTSDVTTDVDLTDIAQMENVNLDNLMDTEITISLDNLIDLNLPSFRLVALCLQYIMDIDDFYIQYELPATALEFLAAINNPPSEKHPVPESVSNNFPVVKLNQKIVSDNGECSICLETFKCDDKALFLSCNHYYHEGCIKRWFEEQNFCPICKQEVN